jgi:hypothetical protein
METPTTLQEAIVFFSDPDNCHAFMVSLRWADGCQHRDKREP